MSEPLTVQLPQEASDDLRQQVIAIIGEAVSQSKDNASTGEWLRGFTGVANYLGCSTQSVKRMVAEGLETHTITALPKIQFFSKREVDQFILNS